MIKIINKNGVIEKFEIESKKELMPFIDMLHYNSDSITKLEISNSDKFINKKLKTKIYKSLQIEQKYTVININKNELHRLLYTIKSRNTFFTCRFTKKDGEKREINGIPFAYKHVKGTGSKKQSSYYVLNNYNLFQCYEVVITNTEKLLTELQNTKNKIKGFKRIKIDNIEWIKLDKHKYVVSK